MNDSLMFKLAMCDTTDFLSNPIPSKNQGGINDTDPKPILNVLLYFKMVTGHQTTSSYCLIMKDYHIEIKRPEVVC